jgi:hypothetical protein
MKKMMFVLAFMFVAANVKATPYLRLIGPDNYQVADGALFSSKGINQVQNAAVLGLITHSTKDGSLLPLWLQKYVAPEDWMIGVSVNSGGGNTTADLGLIFNITPQLQGWGLSVLNYLAPNSLGNLKSFLQTAGTTYPDLNIAIGPMLNLAAIQNGTIEPFDKWALDPLRFFAGGSLKF